MKVDDTFGFKYVFDVIDFPSENNPITYCFPGVIKNGWVDGIGIDFKLLGWYGSFMKGHLSKNAITGVYSYPDRNKILVVSTGAGYLLDPNYPEEVEEININPVLGVYSVLELDILVVHNFTTFYAFNKFGRCWVSDRVSYDGIKVINISDGELNGEAWSAPENSWVSFQIILETGEVIGGAF